MIRYRVAPFLLLLKSTKYGACPHGNQPTEEQLLYCILCVSFSNSVVYVIYLMTLPQLRKKDICPKMVKTVHNDKLGSMWKENFVVYLLVVLRSSGNIYIIG
jgi:hypothetical protein